MSTDEVLSVVRERGLRLEVGSDGLLRLFGDDRERTPALLRVLRHHKPMLLERLGTPVPESTPEPDQQREGPEYVEQPGTDKERPPPPLVKPPFGKRLFFANARSQPCPSAEAVTWCWEGADRWYDIWEYAGRRPEEKKPSVRQPSGLAIFQENSEVR